MRANRRYLRPGFTLLEIVTVLTLLVALGGTSLAIMRTVDLTRRTSMAKATSVRDVQRLADTLRELAHAGASASVTDKEHSLALTDNEYTHTFIVDADGLAIQYTAEPAAKGALARHDRFSLAAASDVEFRVDESRSLIEVDIKRRHGSSPSLTIMASIDQGASP